MCFAYWLTSSAENVTSRNTEFSVSLSIEVYAFLLMFC